ncbi:unnamed protein product [Ixodes pacificus]
MASAMLFKSRRRQRKGSEGAAEQMDRQQARHWQVACDVTSDKHRGHRKAEEARRKAVSLVHVQTEDGLPNFDFHFIWRRSASSRVLVYAWTPLEAHIITPYIRAKPVEHYLLRIFHSSCIFRLRL